MPPRKPAVHPAIAFAEARKAAKAAASEKAARTPHLLTAADLELIPGRLLLELGNAGRLQHLGLGVPDKPAPRIRVTRSAPAGLSDAELAKMGGAQISKAMAGGQVPGVGARRKGRRHP